MSRSKGMSLGDAFLIAKRSADVTIGGIKHRILAGVTHWARDCPELRRPEVAALFGIRLSAAVGATRSSTWLPTPSAKGRDCLAPEPKSTPRAHTTRVDYSATRIRIKEPT
jgi:hypothetical protein